MKARKTIWKKILILYKIILTENQHLPAAGVLAVIARHLALYVAAQFGTRPNELHRPVHSFGVVAGFVGLVDVFSQFCRALGIFALDPLIKDVGINEPLDHQTVGRRVLAQVVDAIEYRRLRRSGLNYRRNVHRGNLDEFRPYKYNLIITVITKRTMDQNV